MKKLYVFKVISNYPDTKFKLGEVFSTHRPSRFPVTMDGRFFDLKDFPGIFEEISE